MSGEREAMARVAAPVTEVEIRAGLAELGIGRGDIVLAHVSLSRLGWICVGPQTLIETLLEVIGAEGTLVMPGFSTQLSDPAQWQSPPVPEAWIQPVRDAMPLFDPRTTPTRGLGRTVECFRMWPGTVRSAHPQLSFLANGAAAAEVMSGHALSMALGPGSPLGKLYGAAAKVLFLGTDYATCTAFHLAEYRIAAPARESVLYPTHRQAGRTMWTAAEDVVRYEDLFPTLGAAVEPRLSPRSTNCLGGAVKTFSLRAAVDAATDWLAAADLPS